MQAYLLLDAAGNRLDVAPKEIVKDARRRAGAVENGISCIGCHNQGMNRPRVYDEIVKYAEEHRNDFQNRELTAIRELYPTNGAQILDADSARYLTAMQAAGGRRPDPGVVEYDDFINLVGQYEAKVGLRGGALELGLDPAAARGAGPARPGRRQPADDAGGSAGDPRRLRLPHAPDRPHDRQPDPQFCRGTFTEDLVRNVCE